MLLLPSFFCGRPFAHLDRQNSLKLLNVLSSFCQSGGTAIVVEYRLDFIRHYTDVLWFLKQGQIDADPNLIQPKRLLFKSCWMGLSLNRRHIYQHLDFKPDFDSKSTPGLLECRDIKYRYPKHEPQSNIDQMSIYKGEMLFVLGKNGREKVLCFIFFLVNSIK